MSKSYNLSFEIGKVLDSILWPSKFGDARII